MIRTCAVCGAARSFYKINGLGAEEFPPLPKFKDDKKGRFAAGNRQRDAQRRPRLPSRRTSHGTCSMASSSVLKDHK